MRIHHKLDGQVCRLAHRRQQLLGGARIFKRTDDGHAVVGLGVACRIEFARSGPPNGRPPTIGPQIHTI